MKPCSVCWAFRIYRLSLYRWVRPHPVESSLGWVVRNGWGRNPVADGFVIRTLISQATCNIPLYPLGEKDEEVRSYHSAGHVKPQHLYDKVLAVFVKLLLWETFNPFYFYPVLRGNKKTTTSTRNECPVMTLNYLMVRLRSCSSGEYGVPLHYHYADPLGSHLRVK